MSDGQLTIEYIMENYEDWGWLNSREDEINEKKRSAPKSWSYVRVRSFTLAINPEANAYYRIDST